MSKLSNAKRFVLRYYPGAWWNPEQRAIEGSSHALYFGHGLYERDAWRNAMKNLKKKPRG